MELEKQFKIANAIFSGSVPDKDGYCGCPKCGSRNLVHDGFALDRGYISCVVCNFFINGSDPYEMLSCWNRINRQGFQLRIPLEGY